MDATEQLAQEAKQQSFDQRSVDIFESVYQDAGVTSIKNMNINDSDRILSVLAQEQATPEFIRGFLAHGWQQGIPVEVVQHILNSDQDGDGRTLAQELFTDGSDPFEPDQPQRQFRSGRTKELEL
ncbi:hypothetical protein FNW02_37550 [Komarekiella sp. 'clone 1']|uniref:Uncharacterized protein n=1 Tax=Komarekiella delphini-convector SJRDD-AB1 TaxID=2593771 RepID=A0AA40VVU7_9NOST|nr:hypothetical protein [Komarekiella delphini-convector]MBD6621247.1 hypothetical protein [Komarekiella delphini-convector SJRDD-AB1]